MQLHPPVHKAGVHVVFSLLSCRLFSRPPRRELAHTQSLVVSNTDGPTGSSLPGHLQPTRADGSTSWLGPGVSARWMRCV